MSKIFLPAQKPKKLTKIVSVIFVFLLCATALVIPVVMAYFTATASLSGDLTFADIQVKYTNTSGTEISSTNAQTQTLNKVVPGDTITLHNFNVKNTGNVAVYTLLNLKIDVTKTGCASLHYNEWYNLNGEKVDTSNFAINTANATKLTANASKAINISFTFDGDEIDNSYKTATGTVKLQAYCVQTLLPEAQAYVSESNYASYFIIKNSPGAKKNLFSTQNYNCESTNKVIIGTNSVTLKQDAEVATCGTKNQIYKYKPNTTYTISCDVTGEFTGRIYAFFVGMSLYDYNVNNNGRFVQHFATTSSGNGVSDIDDKNRFYWTTAYGTILSEELKITNIQVEEGNTATEYMPYIDFSKDPLRKLGATQDSLTSTTVTRNIQRLEFTGDETWEDRGVNAAGNKILSLNVMDYKYIDGVEYYCNKYEYFGTTAGIAIVQATTKDLGTYVFFGSKDSTDRKIYFLGITVQDIVDMYNAGNPLTVWYVLAEPIYEDLMPSTFRTNFTELEYLQSSGSQNIDTRIISDMNTDVELQTKLLASSSAGIYGSYENGKRYFIGQQSAGNKVMFDVGAPTRVVADVIAYNNLVSIEVKDMTLWVNGTNYGTSQGTLKNPTYTSWLFGTNAGYRTAQQLYYCKIWQNKILVRDFVPCQAKVATTNSLGQNVAVGTLGLYDIVNNVFYTNAGSGTFTAGPAVVYA